MWQVHQINTTRGSFQYFIKGQGEPIAITHHYSEFNEKGNVFAEHFTKHFQVFLINLRGTSQSATYVTDEELSFKQTIYDLEAIREALQIKKWAFAGHSAGGMLAQQYAIQAEHALTFIVAGGTAASYEYGMAKECMYHHGHPLFERMKEIMDLLSKSETPIEQRQALSYEWTLASFVRESDLQRLLKMPNSGKTVGPRLTYFRKVEYPTMDFRPNLPKITIPCWIYAGRYDSQCPVQFGEEIVHLIPSAKGTIFESSNHFPFVEEEERFAEELSKFVACMYVK